MASPSLRRAGWAPTQATLSPAACNTDADYFAMKRSNSTDSTASSAAGSMRRDSTSSTSSSTTSVTSASSPFSPSIAYPDWPVNDPSIATRQGVSIAKAVIPPPNQMPTSYISDDELASIDFSISSRRNNSASAEYDAGAQGISWSETRQPAAPQKEERRRRLPPPPPGMVTVTVGGKRKSGSKERRRKALSMIKE